MTYFKLYCTICMSIKQIGLLNLLHLHLYLTPPYYTYYRKKNIATSIVKQFKVVPLRVEKTFR